MTSDLSLWMAFWFFWRSPALTGIRNRTLRRARVTDTDLEIFHVLEAEFVKLDMEQAQLKAAARGV